MKNDENKPRKVQCLQKKLDREKIYVHKHTIWKTF